MSMMDDGDPRVGAARSVTRRHLMARVGSTALIAAAIVFGRGSPAGATYPCGCCDLAFRARCPVNWCLFNGNWLWNCGNCTCCEAYDAPCSASNCC